MGLFDVFKKKDCEICGKEVGMFGYKKLEDGEICKDCVKLLSPWFDDRRHSTVAQIKQQLVYRAQNQKSLETFRSAVSYGEGYTLHAEIVNGVPTRFLVAQTDDFMEENADIIPFTSVRSFHIEIEEEEEELKDTNSKGEEVSYNPPRYAFSYDFHVELQVDSPYFDDIHFRINASTLTLETVKERKHEFLGRHNGKWFDPTLYPEYREYRAICDALEELFQAGTQGKPLSGTQAAPVAVAVPVAAPTAVPVQPAPEATAAAPKFCPNCGAPTGGAKFCQSCGTRLC